MIIGPAKVVCPENNVTFQDVLCNLSVHLLYVFCNIGIYLSLALGTASFKQLDYPYSLTFLRSRDLKMS